jgi:hypothetical protein
MNYLRADEPVALAKVLREMVESGPAPEDLWTENQQDGDPFIARAAELLEGLAQRVKHAEDALRELVILKDMKAECLRVRQRRPCSVTRVFPKDLLDLEADYNERKPKAWDAARAVLGPK